MGDKIKKALKIAAVVFIAATIFSGTAFVKNATFFKLTKATALAAKAFAYTLALGLMTKGIGGISGNFGNKQTGRAPTEPRQIIYGLTRVGGTIVHLETTDTDNHLLHMVICIAGHEVNSLESVKLNDVTLTTSSSTISGSTVFTATNSEYTNTDNENNFGSGRLVRFTFQDGSQTAVDGFMDAQLSTMGSTDKFTNIAYVYMQCVFDPEKFGGGMPNVTFTVKGKKVYDPRLNSGSGGTAWSDNPALIVRDYLTDTTYGLKAKSSEINDGNVAGGITAAANTCDGTVTLADGSSTEKRYTANGFSNFAANGAGFLNGILESMAGNMSFVNGQFQVFAGAHPTPSLTITDDDLLAPLDISTKSGTGDLYNTVKSVFVDSSNDYIAGDTPIYQDSTFLTEDTPNGTNSDKPNYVKTMEKQLPFTTTHTMAQRLQRIALKKQRLPTSISALVDLKFMQLQPHDTVNVTNERLGFSSKIFEVLSMEMVVQDSEDVPTIAVGLVLRETASSVYDFATSDYQTPLASGSAVASGTFAITAPTNLSVASNTEVNDSYNTKIVVASWTNSVSSLVSGTEVQFKRNSASAYSSMIAGRGVTSLSVGGLEVGQVFNFRIRHFGLSGTQSDFTSVVNHTVSGSVVAQSTLTNSTVNYASDGTGTLPNNRGGTGITDFSNSTHLNSNTTKSDVDLANVENKSAATILAETHTGNVTGTIGGVANSTITSGATKADTVINSDNRFTGDFFLDSTHITAFSSKSAFERALAGLDTSGNVNRAVPAAQLNSALVTVLNADSQIAQWISSDGSVYSPTSSNIDLTVTADNGTSKESCTIRWSFVNVSNSTADYISACVEQADASNAFTLGSITDLSGNNVKSATCVVTHTASSETITLQALLSLTNVSGGGK